MMLMSKLLSLWEFMVMKPGGAHKREKEFEYLEEDREVVIRGHWARSVMGSLMGLPKYFLAAVLILQVIMLVLLRGLPLPIQMPVAWFSASSCDTVEVDSANATADVADGFHKVVPFTTKDYNMSCELGLVYVYELPQDFNFEVIRACAELNPWGSFCPAVMNSGLGEVVESEDDAAGVLPQDQRGAWFKTDQFTGEMIFHRKMMEHPCVTSNPEVATAFYVPFYVGLAVGRYLWRGYSAERRDHDAKKMIQWLQGQKYWNRHHGVDHFLMVGRITWDFRRSKDEDWGSSFLHMPEVQNVTRLLIERNPWDDMDMGVPYPTAFHPRSEVDVANWQNYVRGKKRSTLFSFAGAGRSFIPNDFRGILHDQCKTAQSCSYLDCAVKSCANNTMAAIEVFLDSTFCLQPRGDSFTRKSIFDCLIAGSIPVFFWHRTAYLQYQWHLPEEPTSYSVFISKSDVRNGTRIEEVLKAIPPHRVEKMREKVISSIPNFVYSAPGHRLKNMKDAIDISLEGVLKKINGLNLDRNTASQPVMSLKS